MAALTTRAVQALLAVGLLMAAPAGAIADDPSAPPEAPADLSLGQRRGRDALLFVRLQAAG